MKHTLTALKEMFASNIIRCEADKETIAQVLVAISEGNDHGKPDYVALMNYADDTIVRIFEGNEDANGELFYTEVNASEYSVDAFLDDGMTGYYLQKEDN